MGGDEGFAGMPKKRVVVVDDHTVFAELLTMAVRAEPDFEVVGHAQSAAAGMAMVEARQPDVVIMDVHLGDGDGIAATEVLTEHHPALLVVILTAHADADMMRRAAAANACALLPKDGDLEGLLHTLRNVHRDSFEVNPKLMRQLTRGQVIPTQRTYSLTPREHEVLRLLATGLDARQIAREAGISVHTARGHVKSILSKLDAHSQLEAVATAMRHGVISVDSPA